MTKKEKKTVQQELDAFPKPAFLREDYPYQATGDPITDLDLLSDNVLYELKCPQCEAAIRSQGKNIKGIYHRFAEGAGCFGCGNKSLILRRVDIKDLENMTDSETK